MNIVHLTASPFFGGPERQILGLATHLPADYHSVILSFPERGLCRPFLEEAERRGVTAAPLDKNAPHVSAAVREVARRLREQRADILCCHGYKADLIGLRAARQRGIPVIGVSRGWTGASWRVRLYEWLDRWALSRMDAVVCVSDGQARKVRLAGVPQQRIQTIRNAIRIDRFPPDATAARSFLLAQFDSPRRLVIGAAGRLSPEKGFEHLVEAAARVVQVQPDAGFVLFGDGPLYDKLRRRIAQLGLKKHFVLAGFRGDLDRWIGGFDVTALPSHTEGLPNIVLESLAASVPVVATAVGGTPEVLDDGISGYLVPPGDSDALAQRLLDLLGSDLVRHRMGQAGQRAMRERFTFETQARQYTALFDRLSPRKAPNLRHPQLGRVA